MVAFEIQMAFIALIIINEDLWHAVHRWQYEFLTFNLKPDANSVFFNIATALGYNNQKSN
jgi:hypothetical protein